MTEKTTETEQESNEEGTLVIIQALKPLDVYGSAKAADAIISRIESEVAAFQGDISTDKGRKEMKSFAYKIARSRTALEELADELMEPLKKEVAIIAAEKKRVCGRVQELQDMVKKPLTDWTAKDSTRKAAIMARIDAIKALDNAGIAADEIQAHLDSVNAISMDGWDEFEIVVTQAKMAVSTTLEKRLADRKKWEADQAELAAFRAAEVARQQKDREDAIARTAAENARKEAEAKAARDAKELADKADADRLKAEKERKDAETAAAAEKARIVKEKEDADARAKKAESDRLSAAEKAKEDARLASIDAQKKADAAAKAERDKIAAEQKAKDDAAAKREADQKHKAKINNEALAAMQRISNNESVEENKLKAVLTAIAKGEVPHVKISY